MTMVKGQEDEDGAGLYWEDGTRLTDKEGEAWWAGYNQGHQDGEEDAEEDMLGEIMRLREALQEIAKTDIQTWAKAALEKGDWAHKGYLERIAEYDQQGVACRALAGAPARAALGEGK